MPYLFQANQISEIYFSSFFMFGNLPKAGKKINSLINYFQVYFS
jgi:hypothetical protein